VKINPIFYLTKRLRYVIIYIVNYLLNLYSTLVAKRFETLYNSKSSKANGKALDVLDHYRTVRRMLPLMADGNHMGNHAGSNHKSYMATQGQEPTASYKPASQDVNVF